MELQGRLAGTRYLEKHVSKKIACRTAVVLSILIALAATPSCASPSRLEHDSELSFGRHRYQRAWNQWPWGTRKAPDSNFTTWDRLESVRESKPFNNQYTEKQGEVDDVCRRLVLFVGYIVAIQSFSKLLSSNNNLFWDEVCFFLTEQVSLWHA